jgi:hypothetical protein
MLAFAVAVTGIPTYVATRLGLLPTVVSFFSIATLLGLPHPASVGDWTRDPTVLSLLPAAALMVFGYSQARRRRLTAA